MKQTQLPIPAGWNLFFEEVYRRVYRQVTSPWTKLVVLACLTLLLTQRELSFSFSINGGGLFATNEASVFTDSAEGPTIHGSAAGNGEAKLASYVPPVKE